MRSGVITFSGLFVLLFRLNLCVSDEPSCRSVFDYEQKTAQKLFDLERKIEQTALHGSLSSFVRWGRNRCPEESTLVYSGYAGGKKWNENGSGSNTICLPSDPTWSNFKDGNDGSRGRIYGTEIDVQESTTVFDYAVNDQDTPCAVCTSPKPVTLMIPGRANCYPEWKIQYGGYLMSAYHDHSGPHSYVCVDSEPEFVPNSSKNNNDHIFYLVEAQCGSLPCPPYVQGREVACVVCSK